MPKLSPNAPCPCGSGIKYKKCCAVFHKGARPSNALLLMKSRYSAYAAGEANYLMKTTHPNNAQYMTDTKKWKAEIEEFCNHTELQGLEIVEFIDGEQEAFVSFKAKLSSGEMVEKSRFLKVEGIWLYESGKLD